MRAYGHRHRFATASLAVLLALTLTLLGLLLSRSAPAAEEPSEEAQVVRELPSKRQIYSTRFLLDNGQFRTVFSQAPVHYKDAEGAFQPVDLTLKATEDDRYEAKAAPLVVSFGDGSEESAPISVSSAAGTVSMELEDAAESVIAVDGAKATYAEVLPGVDVVYETLGDGLKETLVLASAESPNAFTYTLSHAGFTLKKDAGGEWGLFKAEAQEPAFHLGGIAVWDSSLDEGEMPAFCDGARLVVEPGKGKSSITYTVPKTWLENEARIYPVSVDPNLFTRNPTDTYISPGYPNTCYGTATNLLAGKVSAATGYCRTLVKFPQLDNENNLPDDSHIADATFSIRQYWQPTTNNDRTHVYRVGVGSTLWGEGGTWNTITLSDSVEISPDHFSPSGSTWLNVSCPGVVQYWATRADSYNKGFQIRSKSSEGSSYARKFRSGEYADADYRPKLSVDWERPSMDSSADQASYEVGETVTVTVDLGTEDSPYTLENADQVTTVKMGVNRLDASAENRRGILGWFATPPTDAGWVHEQARNESDELDGYFAYYSSTAYGSDHVTPLLSSCEIADDHESVTFTFAPNESWGTVDDNQMDTLLEMRSGNNSWSSGWVPQTTDTFDVSEAAGVPQPLLSLSSTTTATSSWFSGTTNDTTDEGRGTVTLSWPTVPLADSYKVYLWDGAKYNLMATTTSTTWTTPTDIFPTDTQIAAFAVDYTGNPYDRSNGRKLRDNPNLLYQKMDGSTNKDADYRFKVVPHNNGYNDDTGIDADIDDCAPLRVTLDNRTVTDDEDPQHTDYEFEGWNGHEIGAELDSGTMTANVTDLSIASYGPAATLSRSYRSDESSAGLYAPGWFFDFEQSLDIGASEITYTDVARREHTFTGSGSSWSAPTGFMATLAPDGSNWELTFFDQTTLTFDSSGNLISESDAHGNETSYTWASGKVTTITAENGQEIDLTYSGAKLSSASYETTDGTRTVDYATSSPWSLTRYPSSACESALTYAYTSDRLTSITQEDWPAASDSVELTFAYTSGDLTAIYYPDYHVTNKPSARVTIAYDGDEATIQRYGTVDGTANQAMHREVLTWRSSSAGVPDQLTSRVSGSGGSAVTETYNYAFDRQLATTTDSEGGQSNDTIDTSHDVTSETQTTGSMSSANQITTYAYDSQHRATSETTYQSPTAYATTTYTYDGVDLEAEETADQVDTVLSASSYTYDSSGRQTQEKKLIYGTPASGTWTQTDYSDFADCGEPETTVAQDVKLSVGGAAQDLTKTTTYDDFGNRLTEKDWSNSRTVATNTYDIAGHLLTTTDEASVVTNTSYDGMGNATEIYRTASGTQKKADWSVTTYDAMGRELTITEKLSDASGSPTTASVITNSYDGSGNELTSADSTLGGENARTLFDAQANDTEVWHVGVANYTDAGRSTRSVYDAEGNVTYGSQPGNTNAPGSSTTCTASTYDEAGNTLSEERPDGSKTLSAYDGQGNVMQTAGESTATGDFSPWDTASAHDASGQAVGITDPQQSHEGLETTSDLDLLGRTTEAQAERDGTTSEPETTTTHNDLGWVLQSVDANGVTTSTTYDTHGAVTSETVGGKTTSSSYNATTGRLTSVTDDDDTVVTYTYNAFGNVTRELHEASDSTDLKDINTTYDSLGRPTDIDEDVAGSEQDFTYPQNTASGIQETIDYGASPAPSVAVTRNGRNMETSRVATIATSTTVTRSITDSSGRDTADRWTTASIQKSGRSAVSQSRSFDVAGRFSTQSGLGLSSAGSYSYDANSGRKTAVSLPLALGGSITDSFEYYPGGRLAGADTNDVEATYAFDEVGNLISDAVNDVGTTSFSYDVNSRLTQSDFLADYEGATAETTYYGFDTTRGQRTSQGSTSTAASHEIEMAYNALGMMSSYDNDDTDTEATYTYDVSGQRTKSVVAVDTTTTTTEFAYDGLTLMSLSATRGSSTWRVDYFYDEEGTPFGGLYRTPSSSDSPTYFSILTNDHGDVLEICDADGDAFASYRYDAWGLPQGEGSYATGIWTQDTDLIGSLLADDIASRQILRYAGYAYDAESGFHYCSARYYDPATRQWTSIDPAKADGEESAYQYCGGDPVAKVDPTGQYSVAAPNIDQHVRMWKNGPIARNWCWAACVRSVVQSMKGKKPSLRTIVKVVKGRVVDQGGRPWEIKKGLRKWGVVGRTTSGPVSWSTLNSNFKRKRPVIAGLYWWVGSGHAVVLCSAYYDSSRRGFKSVKYMDPGPGRKRVRLYSSFKLNNKGHWGVTIRCRK